MTIGRREFLAMPAFLATAPTDVRIDDLKIEFEDFRYRAPYEQVGQKRFKPDGPVVFVLMDDFQNWISRHNGRPSRNTSTAASAAPYRPHQ